MTGLELERAALFKSIRALLLCPTKQLSRMDKKRAMRLLLRYQEIEQQLRRKKK